MITDLPIIGFFDQQRFLQFNPSDTANWFLQPSDIGKKKVAFYPVLGRRHVTFLGENKLKFLSEPRGVFKTIKYWYAVVGNKIIRIDKLYNQVEIGSINTPTGNIFFTYIVAGDPVLSGNTTFAVFADGKNIYVYDENKPQFYTVTDSKAPKDPIFLATFGNRIVASGVDSSTFILSKINLGGNAFDPALCFQPVAGSQVFAQEVGPIRQMAVLQNTLYIFTDFTCGVWSNIPSQIYNNVSNVSTTFPWKKNTTYDFNYGMSDPNSLDVDFGIMVWMAQNRNGMIQPMMVNNGKIDSLSTKAIDVLLQRFINVEGLNPIAPPIPVHGFLYDYENTIFYRISEGSYFGSKIEDNIDTAVSLEYNFETKSWHRCIEINGERNRVQKHIYFGNKHLVTVLNDSTVYELSGRFYNNEITNPLQINPQALDYYIQEPFRYERVTPIICAGLIENLNAPSFYAEFDTKYIEIDFVWGMDTFVRSTTPFDNTIYIIDESGKFVTTDQNTDIYLVSELSNTPTLGSPNYNAWFKPHIELLFSNDGGISYQSADVREFSQVGVYQWRMRWYQLGTSRNRVYKLICVSPSPIVILGGVMEVMNVSGGAA